MPQPFLTMSHVRGWTAERFVERGQRYFEQGRIQHPRRRGPQLIAQCHGSQPAPYRVEVTLGDEGIRAARCSCPMGEGGGCKHVVALLLTWIHQPEAFTEEEALSARLRAKTRDQLVRLIERMIDRHPDLETMVALAAGGASDFDAEVFGQRVEQVFAEAGGYDHHGYGYGGHTVARDLEPFIQRGDDYAEAGHRSEAAQVYRITAQVILDHYETFADEGGALDDAAITCAERLGELLAETDDPDLRTDILRGLFDIYRWDLSAGGFGIGDPAHHTLLEDTSAEERHQVAEWVREALPSGGAKERKAFDLTSGSFIRWDSSSWTRERLGAFLLDLEADRLDDEAYLQICRDTGQTDALVRRLLDLDRVEAALDALREAPDSDVYRLADWFVDYGAGPALRDLVHERIEATTDPDARLVGWLRDYAAAHDDPETALVLSRRLFRAHPSVDRYERVRDAAQALGRWDGEQSAILDRLTDAAQYHLLTRLHLSDGNVDAALQTVQHATARGYGGAPDLNAEVARAAEDPHPERAADLYLDLAGDLIDERGRKNYARAAQHLTRVRRIYRDVLTDATGWNELIEIIREDYDNLPALQDELDKAGL